MDGAIFERSKTQSIVTKRTKNMHSFMEKNFNAQEANNQVSKNNQQLVLNKTTKQQTTNNK